MLKEILGEIKKEDKMEVYAFAENKKTGTIHILKANQNLQGRISGKRVVFNHKSFNMEDLKNFLIIQDVDDLGNRIFWAPITDARLTAAQLANRDYNVCGNCVRELYKNEYPDMN